MTTPVDMTKGMYRRIYSGFLNGKRINAVSEGAENWFWRLHAVVDDYGNVPWYPSTVMRITLAPKRHKITDAVSEQRIQELVDARLVFVYEIESDRFIHIVGWELRQPAGRNGRRIQRYPIHPTEADLVNPGESGGIQIHPGESNSIRAEQLQLQLHEQLHQHQQEQSFAATRSEAAVSAESGVRTEKSEKKRPADTPEHVWGKGPIMFDSRERQWLGITDDDLRTWGAAYPAVDLKRQLAAMSAWISANPSNGRKSNYAKFITNWLARSQDKGGDNGQTSGRSSTSGGASGDRGTAPFQGDPRRSDQFGASTSRLARAAIRIGVAGNPVVTRAPGGGEGDGPALAS